MTLESSNSNAQHQEEDVGMEGNRLTVAVHVNQVQSRIGVTST